MPYDTTTTQQDKTETLTVMDLTWSHNYCLACDRQTSGGAYCSQSCRLADLETSSSWTGPSTSTETQPGSGFYLSPAINFAIHKSSTSTSTVMSTAPQPPIQPSYPSYFASNYNDQPSTKGLTPSSSHSSLNSSSSEFSPHQLSEQVHSELRAYTKSFDTIRNWRRRTWS